MNFEMRLKEIRKRLGLTQSQVAESLGIDRTRYAKWESGKARPGYESIIQLCALFETSADYLLGIMDNPTPFPENTSEELAHINARADKEAIPMTKDELVKILPTEMQEAVRTLIQIELERERRGK